MPLTIIESPFAGDFERSKLYLTRALRDSWMRGETPFASHAFFPIFLDEHSPEERTSGILAGYSFWDYAIRIAFYIDYGMSNGMVSAKRRIEDVDPNKLLVVENRTIGENPS